MPLDFPDSPEVDKPYLLSNGITYVWDGKKWTLRIKSDQLLNYWSRNSTQNKLYPRNFQDEILFESLGVDYLDQLP